MTASVITFHNRTELLVQAQIYAGRTLVGSCVAGPGETRSLPGSSERYDIFCKNGATGWEIARKLDSEAVVFTLSQHKGRYIIQEAKETDPPGQVKRPRLAGRHSTK